MQADRLDDVIENGAETGTEDTRVKVEFVEIYEDCEDDLAIARNCSNG